MVVWWTSVAEKRSVQWRRRSEVAEVCSLREVNNDAKAARKDQRRIAEHCIRTSRECKHTSPESVPLASAVNECTYRSQEPPDRESDYGHWHWSFLPWLAKPSLARGDSDVSLCESDSRLKTLNGEALKLKIVEKRCPPCPGGDAAFAWWGAQRLLPYGICRDRRCCTSPCVADSVFDTSERSSQLARLRNAAGTRILTCTCTLVHGVHF